jgi:hypothetical protein
MQHGKPYVVGATSAQPDTREGKAGRHRVAERSVVPRKPGNAGGGKGPWFKTSVRRSEEREIGQPSNSAECSEATDGAPCQSEGRAGLQPSRAVRQAVPRGCAASRLPVLPVTFPADFDPTGHDVTRTGGGNEVVFPNGTLPGSVSGHRAYLPGAESAMHRESWS